MESIASSPQGLGQEPGRTGPPSTDPVRTDPRIGQTAAELLATALIPLIKQPLGAIVANAEASLLWLDRDIPDIGRARDAAKRIVRDGHYAAKVLGSVQAVFQARTGALCCVDLNALVIQVLKGRQADLARHEISVTLELLAGGAPVLGDSGQLKQVLANMLSNSMEALIDSCGQPRTIQIGTSLEENGRLRAYVADSGPGFPESLVERLFMPFFTTKPNAMGMGLAFCRCIVEMHGGTMSASPCWPRGSTFWFSLPPILESDTRTSLSRNIQRADE